MKIVFSDRAFAAVMAETTEKIKTETGGLFLGKVEADTWYVVEAIDPGPKSVFEVAYFEYDRAYTQHLINKIANLYDAPLSLIGLWHRHPGSFDQFSSTDDGTNSKYAAMRPEGAISCLVNVDPDFRLTCYHVARPCRYSVIEYDVGNYLIPDELLAYKKPERFEKIMDNILHGQRKAKSRTAEVKKRLSLSAFMDSIKASFVPLEEEVEADTEDALAPEKILDEIFEDMSYMTDVCGVTMSITQSGPYICLTEQSEEEQPYRVYFKYQEKTEKVIFSIDKDCFSYTKNAFSKAFEEREPARTKDDSPEKEPEVISFADRIRKVIRLNRNGDRK